MPDLRVRLVVRLSAEPETASAMTFSHWLPLGESGSITCTESQLSMKLCFDSECTRWATRIEEGDLHRHARVDAFRIYADVTVNAVDAALASYMAAREYNRDILPEERPLQGEYDQLAWEVLCFAVGRINRLVAYARSRFGQYWLIEHKLDRGNMSSSFVEFKARGTVDGTNWFLFYPTPLITLRMRQSSATPIPQDAWDDVRRHVISNAKAPLVGTLLAGARLLSAQGHGRAALTEAVTALEVALFRFASSAKAEALVPAGVHDRFGLDTLKALVERLGLTESVSWLLPMFPESVFPTSTLRACRQAIVHRQNVVHGGQREVREDVLNAAIADVADLCARLQAVTSETE